MAEQLNEAKHSDSNNDMTAHKLRVIAHETRIKRELELIRGTYKEGTEAATVDRIIEMVDEFAEAMYEKKKP